jgi:hypothetical protein
MIYYWVLIESSFYSEFNYRNVVTYLFTYLLTYLLTHSMVQKVIWKGDCHSAIKKYPAFCMEPEGSSPCSQKPATGPCPEPAESSSPHLSLSP